MSQAVAVEINGKCSARDSRRADESEISNVYSFPKSTFPFAMFISFEVGSLMSLNHDSIMNLYICMLSAHSISLMLIVKNKSGSEFVFCI